MLTWVVFYVLYVACVRIRVRVCYKEIFMRKRRRLTRRRSRRMFSHGASMMHKRNFMHASPMRGGIRL